MPAATARRRDAAPMTSDTAPQHASTDHRPAASLHTSRGGGDEPAAGAASHKPANVPALMAR